MTSKSHVAIMIAAVVGVIASIGASAQSAQTEHLIDSVREIRASLRVCWISPAMKTPPQLTVRFSLKRNGEILGQPLISYANLDTSEEERAALHAAVAAALARCTPLPTWRNHRRAPNQFEVGRGMEAQRSADGFT
jgi:hypothetical protein